MREEEDLQVEVADPIGEEKEVADPSKRKKNATERKKPPTSESRQQHTNTHHQRRRNSPPATGEHRHHCADTHCHRSLTRKKWIELGEEKERTETVVGLLIEKGWGGCEIGPETFIFPREPAVATPSSAISVQNRQPSAARSRTLETNLNGIAESRIEREVLPTSNPPPTAKRPNRLYHQPHPSHHAAGPTPINTNDTPAAQRVRFTDPPAVDLI